MADEAAKGKKKGGKRMVDTNVRITKDTHQRLRALASILGMTLGEAVDFMIDTHYPEVQQEIQAQAERRRKIKEKAKPIQQ